VVHVANGAHVDVRLGPLEFSFCHFSTPKSNLTINSTDAQRIFKIFWCPWRESDPRPLPYQGSALPLSHKGEISPAIRGAGDGNRTRVISLEG
jgi:hypothetical protein